MRPGVTLDAFVVMPDHVHGVLWIDGDGRTAADIEAGGGVGTPRRGVSTVGRAGAAFVGAGPSGGDTASARPWRPGVLGAIVSRLKSACTRRIRAEVAAGFAWQPRFYDVLVRDARRLAAVRRYILTNPARYSAGATPTASVAIATRMSRYDAAEATCASSPIVASRSA